MTSEALAASLMNLRGVTACQEQLADLLDVAVRYARIRVDWALREQEERFALDAARTAAHEVLIDSCNILSRAMLRAGESNEWRAHLGSDRKRIGDVACHVHCLLGLAGR